MSVLQESIDKLKLDNTPESNLQIAKLYLDAPLNQVDVDQAYEYLKKAADSRLCEAQYLLGRLCFDGYYREPDYETALKYFELSAWQNHGPSYSFLGYMHHDGLGTRPDHIRAHQMYAKARLFLKAAQRNNDPDGFIEMGIMYLNEYDCDRDIPLATEYFEKAAALGSHRAYFELALLSCANPQFKEDPTCAFNYFMKAFEHSSMQYRALNIKDNEIAMAALGTSLILQGQGDDGFPLIAKSKYIHLPEVAFAIGYHLYKYEVFDERTKNNAQTFLTTAVDGGIAAAARYLADYYEYKNDSKQSFAWYTKAAEMNDDFGLYSMGIAHFMGIKVRQDKDKGLELLKRSAKLSFAPAYYTLGLIKILQQETPDYVSALELFTQAQNTYELPTNQQYRTEELKTLLHKPDIALWQSYARLQLACQKNPEAFVDSQDLAKLTKLADEFNQASELQELSQINLSGLNNEQLNLQVAHNRVLGNMALASLLTGKFYLSLASILEQRASANELASFNGVDAEQARNKGYTYFRNIVNNQLPAHSRDAFRDILAEAWFELSKIANDKECDETEEEAIGYTPNKIVNFTEDQRNQRIAESYLKITPRSTKELCLIRAAMQLNLGIFIYRNLQRYGYFTALLELLKKDERISEMDWLLQNAVGSLYTEAAVYALDHVFDEDKSVPKFMIKCLNMLADNDDPQAHLRLAKLSHKIGSYVDAKSALQHYQAALDLGLSEAALPLAEQIANGRGCPIDHKKAFNVLLQAANQGFAEAQFKVAQAYFTGTNVERNVQEALGLFSKAAEQNHAESLFTLGQLYEEGNEVSHNDTKALEFYQRSAEQGYQPAVKAVNRLKFACSSLEDSTAMLEQDMSEQDTDSVFNFYHNKLVNTIITPNPDNLKLILTGLNKLAQNGVLNAQRLLIQLYQTKIDEANFKAVQQDSAQDESNNELGLNSLQLDMSLDELRAALIANQKLAAANDFVPALAASIGYYLDQQDLENARPLCQRLLEITNQGLVAPDCYINPKDAKKAARQEKKQAKKAARRDNTENEAPSLSTGQLNALQRQKVIENIALKQLPQEQWQTDLSQAFYGLAKCYEQGCGVPQNMKQALDWYNKAAEAGNHEARFTSAMLYLNGAENIPQDQRKAVNLLTKLAKRKHPLALYELGKMYISGKGVTADLKEGFNSIRQSAELGYVDAMAMLSKMYAQGNGTQASPKLAKTWMEKATALGWSE